jgi:hypothetical protein
MSVERKPIALTAGAAIMGALVIPLAFTQKWFDANPYLLPSLLVVVIVLCLWAGITSDWFKNKLSAFMERRRMLSLATLMVVGALIGAGLGAAGWWAVGKNREHLVTLKIAAPEVPTVTMVQPQTTKADKTIAPEDDLGVGPVPASQVKITGIMSAIEFIPTDQPRETRVLMQVLVNNERMKTFVSGYALQVVTPYGHELVSRGEMILADVEIPSSWTIYEGRGKSRPTTKLDGLWFRAIQKPTFDSHEIRIGVLLFTVDAPLQEVQRFGTKFYVRCEDRNTNLHLIATYTVGSPSNVNE